ncbi:potassium channel family protein [Kitasatospora viridis]|uniref:Ion channel n=1 Tax=Kitasatospora viridis TaxID=281105 RepID=A0A561UHE3_9ACTN|nr:potassium channel family protein [Kitasatospora viridis]TWF98777.1 ion channel [Kitasatospora viridis]
MEQPPDRHSALLVWLLLAGVPAVLLTAFFTLPLGVFGPEHPALSWTLFIVVLAGLAALLVRQIGLVMGGSERGRPAPVIAAASFLALVAFAAAYAGLARQPGEFIGLHTRLDALYFTVVTMATVGYGDITPSGQTARLVVILQIGYTLVFLAAGFTALSQRLRGRWQHRQRPDRHG